MKTRLGFISNSSSSSFICIGTEDESLIEQLVKAEGIKKTKDDPSDEGYYETSCGILDSNSLSFISPEWGGTFHYVGVANEELESILENHSLREAKTIVKNLIKEKTGVDIPDDKIVFVYDEASDEG